MTLDKYIEANKLTMSFWGEHPYTRFGLVQMRIPDPAAQYGRRFVWTHPDGDDVAQKILTGEISAEDAIKMKRKRDNYLYLASKHATNRGA